MSKSSMRARMEALKNGESSSSEDIDDEVYDEAEDAGDDYDDAFVVDDKGYKAKAHQKAAVAPRGGRSSTRRGRGSAATSSRMNRSTRSKAGGSTVISRRRRAAPKGGSAAQASQKGKQQKTVSNFFKKTSNRSVSRNYNSNRSKPAAKPNKPKTKERVDDFMNDLVGDLDSDDSEPEAQNDVDVDMNAAQPTEVATAEATNDAMETETPAEPTEMQPQDDGDEAQGTEPPKKRFKFAPSPNKQAASTTQAKDKSDKAEMSEDDDVDLADTEAATCSGGMFSAKPENGTASKPKEAEPENTDSYPQAPDGMLDFFWFDAYEDTKRKPGQIYLFGKTLSKAKGPAGKQQQRQWQSVCVLVKNIERTLYVLPRLKNKMADVNHGERVEAMDVYQEINEKRVRLGIKKIAAIPVQKKYCFRERKHGVPAEAQYLKVCYSFNYDAMTGPRYAKGKTYEAIFGASSTALELFFLDKQIMGPCWLRIPARKPSRIVSWCKRELELEDPDHVTVLSLNFPSPNLKVLALSFQTVLNDKKEHEIACISGVLNASICVDHANATKNADGQSSGIEYFSLIRKIERNPFPYDLEQALKAKHYNVTPATLKQFSTERELLTFFATRVQGLDPDVVVGHKLFDFVLDVILSRMDKLNISVWSKIGRLRKGRIPFVRGKLLRKWLGAGRLLCDTFVSAQEFIIGEKTYTLSHLATTRLSDVKHHENLNAGTVRTLWQEGKGLSQVITHCCNDANLVLRLMLKLEVLPLTKELTNLCGNLWARSLTSQRAERNEWLLMHEFHRDGYIVPENLTTAEKVEKGIISAKKAGGGKKRGKAQYAGGLVLEPERGLYDKFVLCLDFNSLYPSIIQEYNLCFTSTEHWKFEKNKNAPEPAQGEEEAKDSESNAMAKMQESIGAEMGILPRVIGVLLSRRSTIKKLLKSAKVESERKRLDTQQLALKLTANSMYGCLGFQYSRFYCQPIAQLITALGRESLMKAAEIAQSIGNLRVIYGDTDSIFIYTDSADLLEARSFAKEIKKKVNKTYKRMYLELDYVYSKLLLLRKKKYAALKVVKFDTDAQGRASNIQTTTEIKGLDMVRRDWSIISKEVGRQVLDVILHQGKQIDDTVAGVQELLQKLRAQMDANQIELSRFVITKRLTKQPKDYPDPHKLPHVMVAMEMLKLGMNVSTGSYIEYIVCRQNRDGSDGATAKKAVARRAYHIKEIEASMKCDSDAAHGTLEVDREWYLEQQILPPVGRYCDPIEGTDIGQLADALGLDSNKFKHLIRSSGGAGAGDDEDDLEDKIMRITNPLQKYKDICEPFKITCRHCGVQYDFGGVFDFRRLDARCGLVCATSNCKGIVSMDAEARAKDMVAIKNSLHLQLWSFIQKYYARDWVCVDLGCKYRTRQLPLSGKRCPKLGCSASMKESYKASQLFDQLRYFAFLFDRVEQLKLLQQEKKTNSALAGTFLTQHQTTVCDEIHAWYKKTVLERSKYYFIDSKVIFKYLV